MANQNTDHIENAPEEKKGKMIVICGAKGGIGKTMSAINLAISLYKKGRQVALWDADFQFGDVDISMDLRSTFTMSDVVEGMESLDRFSLQSFMTKHNSGVNVLPAPKRPEYADLITPPSLLKTGELLLDLFDYVVVDTVNGLNEQNLSLLEQADKILLVTTLELASIKSTKLMLDVFRTLEIEGKVQVVFNRSTMEQMTSIEKGVESLKVDAAFEIPNNMELVSQSLNQGSPLVMKRSKTNVAKAIFKIAEALDSNQPMRKMEKPKKRQSLFKGTMLQMRGRA